MGAGKTIEEEPSWVVVNMLLAFLVISVFTEHFMEWIHELLEKRHSEGLLIVHHKVPRHLKSKGPIDIENIQKSSTQSFIILIQYIFVKQMHSNKC